METAGQGLFDEDGLLDVEEVAPGVVGSGAVGALGSTAATRRP
jgi:hypothetical protein